MSGQESERERAASPRGRRTSPICRLANGSAAKLRRRDIPSRSAATSHDLASRQFQPLVGQLRGALLGKAIVGTWRAGFSALVCAKEWVEVQEGNYAERDA